MQTAARVAGSTRARTRAPARHPDLSKRDVLARIADMPQSRIAELLPWNWNHPNLHAALV
jgi:hypothetical protein